MHVLSRINHAPYMQAPPCWAVGRSISRRVRVTGEAGSCRRVRFTGFQGPAKPAFGSPELLSGEKWYIYLHIYKPTTIISAGKAS